MRISMDRQGYFTVLGRNKASSDILKFSSGALNFFIYYS